ncbi:right-handed parallel beta-helix repeat-containing protein [Natronococcus wangiae]|uniref:right-handed parallel beta-helix repeat-containing protein n=1 Tax=Natronococcus wangiae TaxID=3068275 RepID=UPI00273DDFE9|nr:right-handed parallel beta-helix repeat-containing protein [Natronococcus sp. AD5]
MRSVTEYGASGDGTDDDRDAIQAAVDDAHEAGGDRVYLPAGEYRIGGPITHRSRVHLVGDGTGATRIRAEGEGFAALEGSGEPSEPVTDLAVEHLTVDASGVPGDESYDPGEKCIYYQHVRRCRIVGVHAYGSAATGIGTDMMVDSLVQGCVAEDCGRNFDAARDGLNIGSNGIGIGTGLAADAEPVVVADCHARDNGNNGIMFENQATGEQENERHAGHFFVHGCTAIGNRVGLRTSADRRTRFSNCSAHANEEDGIVIDGKGEMGLDINPPPFSAREHRIDGCHVTENGGHGVHVTEADENAAIDVSTSQISANDGAGVRIATDERTADVAVTDCRVFDNGGPGVAFADGGSDLRLADCDVYDNGRDGGAPGIRFGDGAARVTVSGCHISGAAGSQDTGIAFAADHDSVAITENQFHECTPLEADAFPAVVRDNAGLKTESVGTAEAVGDGETTEFVLPHGLDVTPTVRNVWAESDAATGFHVAQADSEAVVVAFADPPTNDARLRWGFEVRR